MNERLLRLSLLGPLAVAAAQAAPAATARIDAWPQVTQQVNANVEAER